MGAEALEYVILDPNDDDQLTHMEALAGIAHALDSHDKRSDSHTGEFAYAICRAVAAAKKLQDVKMKAAKCVLSYEMLGAVPEALEYVRSFTENDIGTASATDGTIPPQLAKPDVPALPAPVLRLVEGESLAA